MSTFTSWTRSFPIVARSRALVLVVAGLCGLLASDANANCSSFTAKTLSTVRGLSSVQSAASAAAIVIDTKQRGNDTAITGLWQTVVSVPDGMGGTMVLDQSFETFTSDGNELMVDTTPPALDNVCNGVWANFGHRIYRIKHPSWIFAADGTLTGSAIIRTDLVLSKNGNQFTGQSTVFFYDLSGNLTSQLGPADVTGKRITVD